MLIFAPNIPVTLVEILSVIDENERSVILKKQTFSRDYTPLRRTHQDTHTKEITMILRYHSLVKILPTLCLSLAIVSCGSASENTAEVVQSHLERSLAYQEQGQYRAAIIEARNIIKKDRNNNLGYLRLAQMYVELGSHKAASDLLDNIPAPNAETQILLAEAYAGQRKFTSAQNALDEYVFQGGDDTALVYQLSNIQILASKNQQEDITEELQTIIAKSPENSEAQNLLTRFYLSRNKLQQAQDQLTATLATNPEDPETLIIAAQLAYTKNDLPAAEAHLTNALLELPETDIMLPQRSQVLKQLSSVMTQQGRTTEALAYTKALAKSNPEGTAAQSDFTRALTVLQEGNVEEAEVLLQKIYADYPNNQMVALYLGLIDYQQGDFSAASELLTSNIDVETASPEVIQTTALSLLRGKQTDKALKLLKEAVAIHSDNDKLIALYGLTALQSGDSQEDGIVAIQRALAMSPELLSLRLGLARFYLSSDKLEQAEAQLKQVLKIEPGHILASSLSAAIMDRSGDNDGAARVIADMLSEKPNDHSALNLAARYALSKEDQNGAKQYYQKSLQLQSENTQALMGLGAIAITQEKFNEASNYYREFIAQVPTEPTAFKGLVSSLEAAGKSNEAVAVLEQYANTLGDTQTIASAVAAEFFLRKGELDKAKRYNDKALAGNQTPYIRTVAYNIGISSAKQAAEAKDWGSARQLLVSAASYSDSPLQIEALLADVEIEAGNMVEAQRLIDKLLNDYPEELAPVMARVKLLDRQDNKQQATALLQQQWQKQPLPRLGNNIYARLKNSPVQATAFLSEWKAKAPGQSQPYTFSALDAQGKGENKAAIEDYEQSLALAPKNAIVLNNLAWLYQESGNSKARETAKKAYDLAPNSAAVMDTYGWILANNGEKKLAIEILEKALALANEQVKPEIEQHLAAAKKK